MNTTPLGKACEEGRFDIANELIELGADSSSCITSLNDVGRKSLFVEAIKNNNMKLFYDLIDYFENVYYKGIKERTYYGMTPMLSACEQQNVEIVKKLVELGADVQSALLHACTFGSIEFVEMVISLGADINCEFRYEMTPLLDAFGCGKQDLFFKLLEMGAEIDLKKDYLLMESCIDFYNGETLEKLVKLGVNVNCKNSLGLAPLHIACKNRNTEIVEKLLQIGANVNIKDDQGRTPLYHSCIYYFYGCDDVYMHNNSEDADGDECIEFTEIFELLLGHGADMNSKDNEGCTVFHRICSLETISPRIVNKLIENGADLDSKDNRGLTPLNYARDNGNLEIVALLIEHGAENEANEDKTKSIMEDRMSTIPSVKKEDSIFKRIFSCF
jgi:ankyrin repeat protein